MAGATTFAGILCRLPWSGVLGLLATGATAVAAAVWSGGEPFVIKNLIGFSDDQFAVLRDKGLTFGIQALKLLAAPSAALAGCAAALAFIRSRISLWLLKAACVCCAMLVVILLGLAWRLPAALHAADSQTFVSEQRNELWVRATALLLPCLCLAGVFLFLLVLRSVKNFYYREQNAAATISDRIWRNLRTHGQDPRFRKSLYHAVLLHVFFVFVLPVMLFRFGCSQKPYGIPQGSGSPVLEIIKIKKVEKKIKKKFVLNLDTAILFYLPKIDESEVFEEVEKLTENIYEAQQQGKLGAGGGKKGGWPEGMEKAKVRFIRLEYDGGDWDQDMGVGADYNMLLKFRDFTGFNIWPSTESVRIADLGRFPRKRAPPFVYVTGGLKGTISVSQSEIKMLRKYCLDMGGMIFADNGGGNFDSTFRSLIRRAFPELPMLEIAYDDAIFKQPYLFPSGAPPLWHHSGSRALGVKHSGRWIVFYHQGDINDAWKNGHSGASEGLAMQAYKLGVNVINYAFNQYMRINFGK